MMRKIFVSLLAYLVSGIAGGIVAQQIAVRSEAGQEFILVFFVVALLSVTAAVAFFAAQFFGPRGIDRTALFFSLVLAALLAVVSAWAYRQATPHSLAHGDLMILGSLALSGAVLIATHWLVVRLLHR